MAGFDITKILNKQTTAQTENAVTEDFEEIKLDYEKIVITGKNKYNMNDIEDLAAGIEMAGGLLDPLILGRINGEYKLAGGHRRCAAVDLLVKDGKEEYREVPCKYKDMTETEFRLYMLIGNTFNRHYTDYDKMIEAEEWKEVLTQAKEEGSFLPEKGVRVRDYIAKIMKTSAAVVGDWNRINNNGTDALKEQFEAGTIGVTAAAAASSLSEEEQNDIAERAAAGEDIKGTEIKEMIERKKAAAAAPEEDAELEEATGEQEEKTEEEHTKATLAQMQPSASDTDTTEEEKENARRLHALKMLEKYYVYLNEDDLRCLEAMLQDCKRRKMEYGALDCGSTI